MSSLMQFRGKIDRQGVHLEFYLAKDYKPVEPLIPCTVCGKQHEQLYTIVRKPRGMFGCWVVFQYNGEEHVPDLSCPFTVEKLPRDAKKLTPQENSATWHKE